jgi:hypothetical protein
MKTINKKIKKDTDYQGAIEYKIYDIETSILY